MEVDLTVKLFPKNAKEFSTNGIKILQPISCVVKEEINGDYSLVIVMPKGDTSIQAESIIKAHTPKGEQLFRVYLPDVDVLSSNTYYGRHIFYDLLDYFIEDKRPNGNGKAAVDSILDGTGFFGTSDIAEKNTATYQMLSPVKALLGSDNSFVKRWGGEIERDNFQIRMLQRVGADRGVSIRYRKNLTGLTVKTDISNVVTRIYPTGRKADHQALLSLPEKYVDSPLIRNYAHAKTQRLDYPDIKIVTQTNDSNPALVTEAQAQAKLRAAAAADFKSGLDKPTVSADVQFVPLEGTEEYKDLAVLERVYIGDTVHIYHEPLDLDFNLRVVSYEYDSILKRYNKITLGTVLPSVGTLDSTVGKAATDAKNSADKALDETNTVRQEFKTADGQLLSTIENTSNGLQSQIKQTQTEISTKVSSSEFSTQVSQLSNKISSKVSASDVSTIIQQSPDDIVYAFNHKDGSTQTVCFTGNGFDFFNNGTNIGHMGIDGMNLNFTLAQGTSIQWNASSDYGMQWYPYDQANGNEGGMHTGNLYPKYLNMKGGKIMDCKEVETEKLTVNGQSVSGITKDIPVKNWDGGTRYLEFVNGLCQGCHDKP